MTNEEAIEIIDKGLDIGVQMPFLTVGQMNEAKQMAIKAISGQRTGHWIEQDGFDGDTYYDCSECGESFCLIDGTPTDNLYNYCPDCGAKMEEHA